MTRALTEGSRRSGSTDGSMRLTGGFGLFSTRRAAEATPLAAAIDRTTGLTVDRVGGRHDRPSIDTGVEQQVRQGGHLAEGTPCSSAIPPRPTGPSSCGTGRGTDGSAAAVVTLRAVDKGGQWKRHRRQDDTPSERRERGGARRRRPRRSRLFRCGPPLRGLAPDRGPRRRRGRGERSSPSLVALSHDRLVLVTGSRVAIIDTSNGKLRKTHLISDPDDGRFSAVAAFPGGAKNRGLDGRRIAADLRRRDRQGGRPHDDQRALVGSRDLSGREVDRSGRRAHRRGVHPRHDDPATRGPRSRRARLRQRPDVARRRRRLATGSSDGAVHYWDVAERKQLADLPHGSAIDDMFAAPQGSVVYSAGNGMVREWDLDPVPRSAPRARRRGGT